MSANGGCLELKRLAAGFGHHQPHRLQSFKGKELVSTCAGLRSGEITTPLAAAKLTLRTLARRIQQLDQELKETTAQLAGPPKSLISPVF